jgi:orotate phosphoribosyltransferase-like protein
MVAGESGNTRHTTANKRKRIVKLRDQGLTYREICDEVGLSLNAVWQHYQAAMRDIPAAEAAAHRENLSKHLNEQLDRIDMAREAAMEVLAARHVMVSQGRVVSIEGEPIIDDAMVLTAIDRLIKLDDQEAKLLGLYAETKMKTSVTVNYTVDGVDVGKLV